MPGQLARPFPPHTTRAAPRQRCRRWGQPLFVAVGVSTGKLGQAMSSPGSPVGWANSRHPVSFSGCSSRARPFSPCSFPNRLTRNGQVSARALNSVRRGDRIGRRVGAMLAGCTVNRAARDAGCGPQDRLRKGREVAAGFLIELRGRIVLPGRRSRRIDDQRQSATRSGASRPSSA